MPHIHIGRTICTVAKTQNLSIWVLSVQRQRHCFVLPSVFSSRHICQQLLIQA